MAERVFIVVRNICHVNGVSFNIICEDVSLQNYHISSEECRLRVFENRILRRIFGPNEKLHSLYRSPNIVRVIKSRRLRWSGHVARMEEGTSAFKILTGKPTGNRRLGRTRHRWEDNIRLDLKEIGINTKN